MYSFSVALLSLGTELASVQRELMQAAMGM
jgi:hypothetical protein